MRVQSTTSLMDRGWNNDPLTASIISDEELFFFTSVQISLSKMKEQQYICWLINGPSMIFRLPTIRIVTIHILDPSLNQSMIHQYVPSINRPIFVFSRGSTLGQMSLIFSLTLNCTSTVTTYWPLIKRWDVHGILRLSSVFF